MPRVGYTTFKTETSGSNLWYFLHHFGSSDAERCVATPLTLPEAGFVTKLAVAAKSEPGYDLLKMKIAAWVGSQQSNALAAQSPILTVANDAMRFYEFAPSAPFAVPAETQVWVGPWSDASSGTAYGKIGRNLSDGVLALFASRAPTELPTSLAIPPVAGFYNTGDLISVYADYVANAAPLEGSWSSPGTSTGLAPVTPTFAGTTPHPAADSAYDHTTEVHLQIWRTDTGAMVHDDLFQTTAEERASDTFSRAPVNLVGSVTYKARFRHRDRVGVYSPWSSEITFTTVAGPNPPSPISPSGKINRLGGYEYTALYSHPDGISANAIQVQVTNPTGTTVLHDSGVVLANVSNNTVFSIAEFHPDLAWASGYGFRTRARDAAGGWSEYGVVKQFNTDAPPDAPTDLSPADNKTTASRSFTAAVSDPDGDPAKAAQIEIVDAEAGTVVPGYPAQMGVAQGGRSVSYTAPASGAGALVMGTDYRWRSRADDGLGPGYGQWSGYEFFRYAEVPGVAVVSPAPSSGLTVDAPLASVEISYSASLAKKDDRLRIERWSGSSYAPLYDSGFPPDGQGSARTTIPVPPGFIKNENRYRLKVEARNTDGAAGESDWVVFDVLYVGLVPALNVLEATADPATGTLRLVHEPSTVSTQEFAGIEAAIRSVDGLEPLAVFERNLDPASTFVTYHFPRAYAPYEIMVRQARNLGFETVHGPWASATVTCEYDVCFVKDALEPGRLYVAYETEASKLPTPSMNVDEAVLETWDGPVYLFGGSGWESGEETVEVYPGIPGAEHPETRWAKLKEIVRRRKTACLLSQAPDRGKTFVSITGSPKKGMQPPLLRVLSFAWCEDVRFTEDRYGGGERG